MTAGPPLPPPPDGRAAIAVEVVLIRHQDDALYYRFIRRTLIESEHPDEAALDLAAASGGAVCHSTSWRYQDATVVLTYAVLPDPRPAMPATALSSPAVMCSGDPLRPTPPGLHGHHVAAHAVRHLAYLADTDPAIAALATAHPDPCWAIVRATGATTPAATHTTAHANAHANAHQLAAAHPEHMSR